MAIQEAKEVSFILKWAAILAFMGAIIGVIVFVQYYLKWRIASFDYYLNFFIQIIINPEYRGGLKMVGLSALIGAMVGAFGPVVFLLKK